MAQHDYNIANQVFPDARGDINNALAAAASNNSGNNPPASPVQCMNYFDTDFPSVTIFMEYVYTGSAWVARGKLDTARNHWVNQGFWDAGSAAAPAISFTADTNTGIYSSAADTLDISLGGTRRVSVSGTQMQVDQVKGMTTEGVSIRTNDGRWFNIEYLPSVNSLQVFLNGAWHGRLPHSTNITFFKMDDWYGIWSLIIEQSDLNYKIFYPDSSSDARLKENVKPTEEDALARLCELPIVQFDWKDTPELMAHERGQHVDLGLIAQDVRDKVHPSLVGGDEVLIPNLKALVPWLIRAVQQLNKEVVKLRERISELEDELP